MEKEREKTMSTKLYNGKWDKIWDKPKYNRIRKKIWEAFDGITFIEESHQYFYHGKEMIPTSNVCHLFRQPFDENKMAEQCSEKYSQVEGHKYYGMTKEDIIESWHQNSKRATDHGTLIHLFGENCAYFMMRQYDKITDDFKSRIQTDDDGNEYVESAEPKEEAVVKFWNDLPVSIIPIVFEIQMFSEKYGISGTADLLFLHDPHIECDDNDDEIMQRLYLMDYKGLPLDTKIPTGKGMKTMEDIAVGDILYDVDKNKTSVINVSGIHNNPCYKITFDDGFSIIADCDHRWIVQYYIGYSECVECLYTTQELYSRLIKHPIGDYYIPTTKDDNIWKKYRISSVTETETVPTKCIEVDSPTHTYVVTENEIVTHNTNADLYKAFGYMKEPFEELPDNDLSGYKLQAAIYSYFLMSIGFGFVSRALIWLKDMGNGEGAYEKVKMESLTTKLFDYLDEHPLKQLLHD